MKGKIYHKLPRLLSLQSIIIIIMALGGKNLLFLGRLTVLEKNETGKSAKSKQRKTSILAKLFKNNQLVLVSRKWICYSRKRPGIRLSAFSQGKKIYLFIFIHWRLQSLEIIFTIRLRSFWLLFVRCLSRLEPVNYPIFNLSEIIQLFYLWIRKKMPERTMESKTLQPKQKLKRIGFEWKMWQFSNCESAVFFPPTCIWYIKHKPRQSIRSKRRPFITRKLKKSVLIESGTGKKTAVHRPPCVAKSKNEILHSIGNIERRNVPLRFRILSWVLWLLRYGALYNALKRNHSRLHR